MTLFNKVETIFYTLTHLLYLLSYTYVEKHFLAESLPKALRQKLFLKHLCQNYVNIF